MAFRASASGAEGGEVQRANCGLGKRFRSGRVAPVWDFRCRVLTSASGEWKSSLHFGK